MGGIALSIQTYIHVAIKKKVIIRKQGTLSSKPITMIQLDYKGNRVRFEPGTLGLRQTMLVQLITLLK